MKKMILTGLTAAMMSASAMASEVVEGTDTTVFSANSPALASEVNGNFAALIAAINDNSQRLDALEGAAPTDLSSIVSGSTYLVVFSGNLSENYADAGSSYKSTSLEHFGGSSLITFNADGTLQEVINEGARFMNLEKEQNCDEFGENCEHFTETNESIDEANGPGGSWSVSGQELTVLWPGDAPGDEETFTLSADGDTMILGGYANYTGSDTFGSIDELETFIAVGVKVPTPAL
ncbi:MULTISPECIES: hypothetical protein [Alcanivorax]|uniref:hypothetical protein n=1 Tax=Alcanivorax TaxID=59753 RepID=UPI0025C08689|nr:MULTISPECIES: hypothetical protein [Alcanivorax]